MIRALIAALALGTAAPALAAPTGPASLADIRARPPEGEVVYFVLPDRFENADPRNDTGGIKGDRLRHGFDPTHKGFFHGGDLKGLTARLPYLKGLGITAIWLTPIFKNKPVQGGAGEESAGYHGYWVTDFTTVDPHLGTEADFKAFVDAAHGMGMKVYMDIITNHTADVIRFAECAGQPCPYRAKGAFPWTRRARDGAPINPGFKGDRDRSAANFARLTDPNHSYTVEIPAAERTVKRPAWLNDPIFYHNRGNSTFRGESSVYGDFVGLDDLMTTHPRVVAGMIDIYASWIDRFGIDGFRIDTAKHVNPEFWQAFVPAIRARAKARGIPNFHLFGEVFAEGVDPGTLATYTRRDRLPTVLDFSFQGLVRALVVDGAPTDLAARLIDGDHLYEGGTATARKLPTFTGNHDMGRLGQMLLAKRPDMPDAELLARLKLANVLMFTMRGSPVVYYGDEQGFTGDGGDQAARENMFPSRVDSYNDNRLAGTTATTAASNFDPAHPLYRQLAELAALRRATPALIHGETLLRHAGEGPGLLAFSRLMPNAPELFVALNTSAEAKTARIEVETASRFPASPTCALRAIAPGSVEVTLPPFGHAICGAAR